MSATFHCTAECYDMPDCKVCGQQKKPVGRDTMTNGYCDSDCPGYMEEPKPGHLWPDEAFGELKPNAEGL